MLKSQIVFAFFPTLLSQIRPFRIWRRELGLTKEKHKQGNMTKLAETKGNTPT